MSIGGRVQGVFFRHHVRQMARQLKLKGYVKNKEDGSVEVIACGHPGAVSQLIGYCRHGPENADIESFEKVELLSKGQFEGFEVRF